MSAKLMGAWSSRRMAIEARTAELAQQFQATHGREPTHGEAIALAQQANLDTRESKHEPRSRAEQRHTWRAQAIKVLGGARELTAMLGAVLASPAQQVEQVDREWVSRGAQQVIARVSQTRAAWQRHHVFAEAQQVVPAGGHACDDCLAERITDATLAEPISVAHIGNRDGDMGEPELLRRRDGVSVYAHNRSRTKLVPRPARTEDTTFRGAIPPTPQSSTATTTASPASPT
jgi:hypothetical protein